MTKCRPLTEAEERLLIAYARRRAYPRDRVIVTAILFAGLELAELRRLTAEDVFTGNRVAPNLRLPSSSPRSQGAYEIPITPEFSRALSALQSALPRLRRLPQSPLLAADPAAKHLTPLSRKGLTRVVQRMIVRAGIRPDRQLGPGSLRKRFAQKIWVAADHDMLILRDALRVWSVIQAMEFLALDAGRIERAMHQRFRMAAYKPDEFPALWRELFFIVCRGGASAGLGASAFRGLFLGAVRHLRLGLREDPCLLAGGANGEDATQAMAGDADRGGKAKAGDAGGFLFAAQELVGDFLVGHGGGVLKAPYHATPQRSVEVPFPFGPKPRPQSDATTPPA